MSDEENELSLPLSTSPPGSIDDEENQLPLPLSTSPPGSIDDEENQLSLPLSTSPAGSIDDEELKEPTEAKENNCAPYSCDECEVTSNTNKDVTNSEFDQKDKEKNENSERICDSSEDNISTSNPDVKRMKIVLLLQKVEELDEKNLLEYLKDVPEDELLDAVKEIEETNSYLLKENQLYEFILNEDDIVQNSRAEMDEDVSTPESFVLSYPVKCYFAKKKLEHTEKDFELKNAGFAHELQNLNFELESLNKSLRDLSESKEKFEKNVRIGGRHPVTKKIMLQKVAKYFDDSIRHKMALTNRYRIQIQTDTKERNKILSQIKAQEKRLASLDMTEFQEAQFEHEKSCRELAKYKEQLGKLKSKFSPLIQSITEMKRALEKEENEMEQMKNAVSKLEHLKEVMVKEKARNDQKVLELKATMRKIKLDPRRHNLPEVIDYAAAKRENAALMKNINKWKKKVQLVQQEKLLHLSTLAKRKE